LQGGWPICVCQVLIFGVENRLRSVLRGKINFDALDLPEPSNEPGWRVLQTDVVALPPGEQEIDGAVLVIEGDAEAVEL
jgi:hypothetical protein